MDILIHSVQMYSFQIFHYLKYVLIIHTGKGIYCFRHRGKVDRRKKEVEKGEHSVREDDAMTMCPRTFFPRRNVLCIFLVFSALIVADPCVVLTLYRIQAVENLVETWVSPENPAGHRGKPQSFAQLTQQMDC